MATEILPLKDPIKVTAAILEKDGRIIIAQRKSKDHLAGKWEFPGGKIEPGETPEECLARELNEEFGIEVSVGDFLGSNIHHYDYISIELMAFRTFGVGGEINSTDHKDYKWVRGHDVVSKDGDLVSLQVKDLTFEQKPQIKMICEKKMQEFIVKRGLSIWDYRLLDKDPAPDSLYYRVMKESGGRCALCGATHKEYPLHVDHIKPRSRGGKTEYENLQVLCSK